MASVAEIESLSEQLFASPDPSQRHAAHAKLSQLTSAEATDFSPLVAILQQSSNQYALMFVSQGLVTWFKHNLKSMSKSQQVSLVIDACGSCLKRVATAGAPRHVTMGIVTAFSKMTKLSFNQEPYLTESSQFALQMLRSGDEKLYFAGLLLLDALIVEHSKYDTSKAQSFMGFAMHRRCSNNFRDNCLLEIFQESLTQLSQVSATSGYVEQVVGLVKNCLTYDFMAIMVDETEDALSSQFPTSWKEVLLDQNTRNVLWSQHAALPYPYCATLLEGLASMCGIRRTFFELPEERVAYLNEVLGHLVNVLNSNDGRLRNPHYVNVFAECCVRFVPPFGYRELHQSSAFAAWIEVIRVISLDVFAIPFGQDGSFTTASTLMNFWARITTSKRMFMHSEDIAKDLEIITPAIAAAFFQSRVKPPVADKSSTVCAEEDDADALEAIMTQCDSLASVASLDPRSTLQLLSDYVHQQLGPQVLHSPSSTGWLFFFAGSLFHHVFPNIEGESVEASTSFFMYCVECANHRRLSAGQSATGPGTLYGNFVEKSLLSFLCHLHQAVACRSPHQVASPSNTVITNIFQGRAQMFQFILSCCGHNMLRSITDERDEESASIMRTSIDLIGDACRDVPQTLLMDVNLEVPPVVDLPLAQSKKTYKLRTNLYAVMWPLTLKGSYQYATLTRFLAPIESCIQSTLNGSAANNPLYVAGWMRDLRGVTLALQDGGQSAAFADYLDWFCEQAGSFQSILASPAGGSPMVIISFLRLMIEVVNSRGGRMSLPGCGNHSALGLLLFKHLCGFIQQIVGRCITEEQIQAVTQAGGAVDGAYELMMKPLSLSMMCLRKCVGESLFPFGAMWFYNDDTFDATLLGLLRMLVVFPTSLFKQYSKVSYSVVDLLRSVTENECYPPLAKLSTDEMQAIIGFVVALCEDVETNSGTLLHSMSFLSFISGLVKEVKALTVSPALGPMRDTSTPPPAPLLYAAGGRVSGTPGGHGGASSARCSSRSTRMAREALAHTLQPIQDLWIRLIAVAMNVIVCQDRALSTCTSVVYPIFEAHPPFWYEFVEQFVPTYPEQKRQQVREALSKLAAAGETQERFFSEVFSFRQAMRSI